MAHTTLIPYSVTNPSRTPRRRHWRRSTTMIVNGNQKLPLSPGHLVHNSTSRLPDIVKDCQQTSPSPTLDNQTSLTCKQIAHSLRMVADEVDQKYCQVSLGSVISFFIRYLYHTYVGRKFPS